MMLFVTYQPYQFILNAINLYEERKTYIMSQKKQLKPKCIYTLKLGYLNQAPAITESVK